MKIMLISLGCDKNLVDSEVMLGLVRRAGHEITNDETEAEVCIINTCAFIRDAQEESINTIIEMGNLKKTGRLKKLIVTGCLSERYRNEILSEMPEIDTILGASNYDEIILAIDTDKKAVFEDKNYMPQKITDRIVTTTASMAYLKIAEGCSKFCTYCAIPYIRGAYRSVPMEELIRQAEGLAAGGIKELVLVAQETTIYGLDLYGRKMLPELLSSLCKISGIEWIRLLYCYPEEITDELIDVIAAEEKICHYIDMPIQHSEDEILKRMGRKTCRRDLRNIIKKLRKKIPDIAIRTTIITGFPGETDEHHDSLMEFIDDMEFDRLGVFTFSPEEGTPAAAFDNQVDSETADRYKEDIMFLQQEISYNINYDFIGKKLKVLVEGYLPDDDVYVGRSYRDAPDVDGMVFIRSPYELVSGTFAKVLITDCSEYDLTGEIVE